MLWILFISFAKNEINPWSKFDSMMIDPSSLMQIIVNFIQIVSRKVYNYWNEQKDVKANVSY